MNNHDYYNAIVNVTLDSAVNAANFMESLDHREAGRALVSMIRFLEAKLDSQATVYGSFKGKAALESGEAELLNDQESLMESVMLRFSDYDNRDLARHFAVDPETSGSLSGITYYAEWDSFVIRLATRRYVEENPGFQQCVLEER